MFTLGIETSCDETAAAVLKDGKILSNIICSQLETHAPFGGVVPEIASRNHSANIDKVTNEALSEAKISLSDLDLISVTNGPGLQGALLVGVSYAKALAYALNKPVIGTHHIWGHICAGYFIGLKAPYVALVASGGHSHIFYVENSEESIKTIGRTRDDAAGEAFDKVGRILGLPYPGGPSIERESKKGNENAIAFPRASFKDSFDFSFSGIKTAALDYMRKNPNANISDVAASFQLSITRSLSEHTIAAAKANGVSRVLIAGGVAQNSKLRETLEKTCAKEKIEFFCPPPLLCADNAAMIAIAGEMRARKIKIDESYCRSLDVFPSGDLGAQF